MKKRKMTIEEYQNNTDAYTIIINNARYHRNFFNAIEKIIDLFISDQEVFWGFCRIDCMNLTLEQHRNLKNDIPEFFNKYGYIQNLNEYLSIARIDSKDYEHSFISLIFDYYLETVMFNPKVDWETFKQHHSNYQEHRFDEIITNHFAEIIIYYYDSGDLLVCFNPYMYNPSEVRSIIELYFKG